MPTKLRESKRNSRRKQAAPLVIDLCSGMGGISLAAKQLNMKVLAGVDIDPSATRTYQRNFPNATVMTGSVRSNSLINDCKELIDEKRESYQQTIVVSGPPCQGFSVAGPRDPNDPRNRVLLAVARFIVAIQPRCAIIENVARILDDNHSTRLRNLTRTLWDGQYHVNEVVLDAADYGVPQRRRRAFFIITRRAVSDAHLDKLFETHKQSPVNVADVLEDLPIPRPRPNNYVDVDDCGRLSNHFAMLHSRKVKAKIAAIPLGGGPMSYRKLHPEQASNTLISGHRAPPAHYSQPRSITVREAMRLQGFPDDFRVYGSFANQMGQVTNAVPPPLAKVALRVLCEVAGVRFS